MIMTPNAAYETWASSMVVAILSDNRSVARS